ncbi:Arylsulfatase [Pirellulimonas nuda]|uniref:Arylsulfatase n=1 Tax=Pirellulimonas nuda TaxID=2528009 RepID=A0A518D5S7_9BACT|nr:arylsulfatase [Pirellulimonas nuda]QDU86819.1 Arylsulfatase [Pirellulimonas nuda]
MNPLLPLLVAIAAASTASAAPRPNVVLIMADDLGYSDIGCYGGEIPTPNLDALAAGGVRFSQFYNTSRCCPTRASLLTGLYQHQAGVGHMTTEGANNFDYGVDGYRGQLNRCCTTLAERLKEAGYHTYMAGKWHLGHEMDDRPLQRGFDKFYGSLSGAFSYFSPQGDRYLMRGNDALPPPDPADYYTTDAFTDEAIGWIEQQKDDAPFFLYLAYNAPHWPLHAKPADIEKFVGKYRKGWDALRQERFDRQVEMGLFDKSPGLSPRDAEVRPWDEVPQVQQEQSDYRMAVYAAQVYSVDENIGRLLDALRAAGKMDDTLIVFLSDNGGCAEPGNEFGGGAFRDINDPAKYGAVSIGRGWANLANTPFREYKSHPQEGGIATPMVAHWPAGIAHNLQGSFVRDPAHIIDVMPTLLELSGAPYPDQVEGNLVPKPEGQSLTPFFTEGSRPQAETLCFEHQGACAARSGKWKAVARYGRFDWQLYDLEADRIEQHDVAAQHPEIVARLDREWRDWALRTKVSPLGSRKGRGYGGSK